MKRKENVTTLIWRRSDVLNRIVFRLVHQLTVNSEAIHTRELLITPVRQHTHFYQLITSRDLLLRNNTHSHAYKTKHTTDSSSSVCVGHMWLSDSVFVWRLHWLRRSEEHLHLLDKWTDRASVLPPATHHLNPSTQHNTHQIILLFLGHMCWWLTWRITTWKVQSIYKSWTFLEQKSRSPTGCNIYNLIKVITDE